MTASENPLAGSRKKKKVYAGQIPELYKKYLDMLRSEYVKLSYTNRSGEAGIQWFRRPRCECQKFEDIRPKNPTGGPSDDDIERSAVAIYDGEVPVLQMYTFIRDENVYPCPTFVYVEVLKYLHTTRT